MIDLKYLEEKYGKEEVRKARRRLKGLTWIGNEEDHIEALIKQNLRTTHVPWGLR